MKRPFATSFSNDYPADRMELQVTGAARFEESDVPPLRDKVEVLVDLAQWGGLSGERIAPADSKLEVEKLVCDGAKASWVFRDVNVDPRTVLILLNCLQRFHQEVKPLLAVRAVWGGLQGAVDPPINEFPGMFQPVPFGLALGDTEVPFTIAADFDPPQTEARVEEIGNSMGTWVSVVNAGGFATEHTAPLRSNIFFTDDWDQITAERLEWYIDTMYCSEQALFSLVNVLHKIHLVSARIRRVEIGDFP